jgi:hypothetical protein
VGLEIREEQVILEVAGRVVLVEVEVGLLSM